MVGFQDAVSGGWQVMSWLDRQGSEIKGVVGLLKLEEPLKEFKQESDIISFVL